MLLVLPHSFPTRRASYLSIIHVHGESMEPTLRDGDEVLVDSSDQGSRLRDGIYVLRAVDALVVKRVTIQPGGRLITISSDNTAYPTWSDVDRSTIRSEEHTSELQSLMRNSFAVL